jgi:hypothetical protein
MNGSTTARARNTTWHLDEILRAHLLRALAEDDATTQNVVKPFTCAGGEARTALAALFELRITHAEDTDKGAQIEALLVKLGGDPDNRDAAPPC